MKKGTILITTGLLLFAAALGVFVYDYAAVSRRKNAVLRELGPMVAAAVEAAPEPLSREQLSAPPKGTRVPDYQLSPFMELPAKKIGDAHYVGILSVPDLRMELPILRQGEGEEQSKEARVFLGTPYQEKCFLSLTQLRRESRKLAALHTGAALVFTDTDGNRFFYTLQELLQLPKEAPPEDIVTDWPLTVYIAAGGNDILALGCDRADA